MFNRDITNDTYRFTANGQIFRIPDEVTIPNDERNLDWQDYQRWLAQGGVTQPYIRPAQEIIREQRKATFDADATRQELITQLSTATPAQINTYVNNNVTDLAGARALFKKILLVLANT